MSGTDKKIQPIVIKRIKKGGHGHHGGAWKIAYADFVTAMMAFFLLMWLLGSTSKGDLKGIADYFSTPLQVALGGGTTGAGDATSIIQGGGESLTRSGGQVRNGDPPESSRTINMKSLREEMLRQQGERMRGMKNRIDAMLGVDPKLARIRDQVRTELTEDGLRITIADEQNRPMFTSGSAELQPYMRELLREIGKLLNEADYRIAVSGHTDAAPYAGGERGYSNWELSTERANASRRELVAGGLGERQVARVVGLGSTMLQDPANPLNPVNRRISILVLNQLAEERLKATESVVVNSPDAAGGALKAQP